MLTRLGIVKALALHSIEFCQDERGVIALCPIAHHLGEWHVFGLGTTVHDLRAWLGY